MLHRLFAIASKELKQVRRDSRTLAIIFIFPLFMLVLYGYALNFDVDHIQIGIMDLEKSDLSRELIKSITASGYFDAVKYFNNRQEINTALDNKEVQAVVVIPEDLSDKFYSKQTAQIQYLVDGVNGNTATIATNYLNAATMDLSGKYTKEILKRSGRDIYTPVDLEPVFWFNPDLKTTNYLIPGLVSSILITLSVVLTAIAIVREKELGTIEQINVSPVTAFELIFGKVVPYTLISFLIAAMIIVIGHFLFGIQVKGSILLLFLSTLLYVFACLNIGIFVSTVADSQQVAFQMSIMISQLPANLLSGFIFPIESMPKALQILSNITPSKFYLVALRSILLKGTGIGAYWQQLVYMLIFATIFLVLATIRIRRQRAQ